MAWFVPKLSIKRIWFFGCLLYYMFLARDEVKQGCPLSWMMPLICHLFIFAASLSSWHQFHYIRKFLLAWTLGTWLGLFYEINPSSSDSLFSWLFFLYMELRRVSISLEICEPLLFVLFFPVCIDLIYIVMLASLSCHVFHSLYLAPSYRGYLFSFF